MVFEADITGLWSSRSTRGSGNVAVGYGADDDLGANASEEGYEVSDHIAAANASGEGHEVSDHLAAAETECDGDGYDADDEILPGHAAEEEHEVDDDSPAGEAHRSASYEEPESNADVPAAAHTRTAICDEPSSYDPASYDIAGYRRGNYFPESNERGSTSTRPSATSSTIVTPGLSDVFDTQEAPEPDVDIRGDSVSNSLGLVLAAGSLVSKEA
jgi:hypothetical protein